MIKSRKGVFFTFIAIFIIILFVAVITTRENFRYREKSNAISSRVKTMNNFIEDFEKDLDRELYIGGYRAFLSMNAFIRDEENYVSDFDNVFEEILMNGSINGSVMWLMKQDDQGADIQSWLARVNEETKKMNLIVEVFPSSITVAHVTPWSVEIRLNTSVYITDTRELASWNFEKTYSREMSILGFEDPMYTIGTQDKVTNLINSTKYVDFVVPVNDTTNLNDHLLNSFYKASDSAPSFLMRFEGNFSNSTFGIESMVNLGELDNQNLPIYERSVIDYIYFYNQTTTDYCNVTGLPGWFRIDDGHTAEYQIETLVKNC